MSNPVQSWSPSSGTLPLKHLNQQYEAMEFANELVTRLKQNEKVPDWYYLPCQSGSIGILRTVFRYREYTYDLGSELAVYARDMWNVFYTAKFQQLGGIGLVCDIEDATRKVSRFMLEILMRICVVDVNE
ncbi:hypothetical protein BDD12DRAFT_808626 [Trichophaea hybrida]|nr:hypothetical protein BDD12DRAFT_808626 [Trichophaea hybrida]